MGFEMDSEEELIFNEDFDKDEDDNFEEYDDDFDREISSHEEEE